MSASIQDATILSCQGASTPLYNSIDNSNSSGSMPTRKCRVRVVDIHDSSDDIDVEEPSMYCTVTLFFSYY